MRLVTRMSYIMYISLEFRMKYFLCAFLLLKIWTGKEKDRFLINSLGVINYTLRINGPV